MRLQVGDLVRRNGEADVLGIVIMVHTTVTGAAICEVVIVSTSGAKWTYQIGSVEYLNQDYWKKVEAPCASIDTAIRDVEAEYEEIIELHATYGES